VDEHGGFYDHVPTPLEGVPPPGDAFTAAGDSYPDGGFTWDRLGIRIPTLLVSPWIERGTVVSAPPDAQKPQPTSEYDLTSILATARLLLSNETPPAAEADERKATNVEGRAAFTPLLEQGSLTDRDAWAATFEHVFLQRDAPRTDCPLHAPDAPPPAEPFAARADEASPVAAAGAAAGAAAASYEATLPLNDLQEHIAAVHAALLGGGAGAGGIAAAAARGAQEGRGGNLLGRLLDAHASAVPTVQGEVSAWYRPLLEAHKVRTAHWRRTKASAPKKKTATKMGTTTTTTTTTIATTTTKSGGARLGVDDEEQEFEVVCQPLHFFEGNGVDDYGWDVNRATNGDAAAATTTFDTVSSKTLRATVVNASSLERAGRLPEWIMDLLAQRGTGSSMAIATEGLRTELLGSSLSLIDATVEVPWCLDFSSASKGSSAAPSSPPFSSSFAAAQEGDFVGASPCFPSAEPRWNRDKSQHWRLLPDTTLRPFSNLDLCATSLANDNDDATATHRSEVVLVPCDGRVGQHFAWHGDAPGQMGNSGALEFGDDLNGIGIIPSGVTSSSSSSSSFG
jgi:hypothetical protein